MKVLIIGGGEVGFHLADRLSQEGQDVILIDVDPDRAAYAADHLDILTFVGNGASFSLLERARVRGARMLLAVTSKDEVNLISCLAAKRMGVKFTVARISSPEYYESGSVLSRERLGIDLMINPERESAWETYQLLLSAAATDVAQFADGRVQLVGVRVREGAPVAGKTLDTLQAELEDYHYVTAAIVRGEETLVPDGSSTIETGDQIYLLSPTSEVAAIPPLVGYDDFRLRRVMIAGGSLEGRYLAEVLAEHGVECTVLERSRKRWMSHASLGVLSFLMLVGRLEIYTVLILFHPDMWKRRKAVA